MKRVLTVLMTTMASIASAGVLSSGSGAVSTALQTGAGTKASTALAWGTWSQGGETLVGKTYGIQGTMELSGQTQNDQGNYVFVGVSHETLNPDVVGRAADYYSINASLSETTWANNEYEVYAQGNELTPGFSTFSETSLTAVFGYAINITIQDATSVAYELGLDFDNNGSYDYFTTGVSGAFTSADRLRLSMGVSKATSTATASLTNAYTYTLTDSPIDITNILSFASGTISSLEETNSTSAITTAAVFGSWDQGGESLTGRTYSVSGTMALSGQTEMSDGNTVFVGITHQSSDIFDGVWRQNPNNSINASLTETTWENNTYSVYAGGTLLSGEYPTFSENSLDAVYGFAINITIQDATSVAYELGLDFDNDGTYDYTTNGITSGFASADRIRVSMGVTKGDGTVAQSLTNSYTCTISKAALNIINEQEPATPPASLTASVDAGTLYITSTDLTLSASNTLQMTTDLINGTWSNLTTSTGTTSNTWSISGLSESHCYYRVISE